MGTAGSTAPWDAMVARLEALEGERQETAQALAALHDAVGRLAAAQASSGGMLRQDAPRPTARETPTPGERTSRRLLLHTALGAAGVLALGLAPTTEASATTTTTGLPVYNVQTAPYGATGNGSTDDTAAINRAIGDAAAAGGGVVYLPAGVYRVSPSPHPQNSAYAACVLMQRGVILQGAGTGASTIRLTDSAVLPAGSSQIYLLLNATINPVAVPSRDQQMVVQDLTFDGNALAQTAYTCGVFWIRCRDVQHLRVRVQNVYGTGSSGGAAETFFFEFQLGSEVFYTGCEAVTTDTSSTSTGFSADGATGITYEACVARGMKIGAGFTHNGCAIVRYSDCHAYSNGGYGFNSEVSEDVRYSNCVAGARADSSGQGTFSAYQSLGNARAGFVVNSSKVVDLTGCSARYNGSHGLWIANTPDSVRVCGGEYSNNNGWGIQVLSGATNAVISHETRMTSNTSGAVQAQTTINQATPFLYDSGWIAATATMLTVSHTLPNRPRFLTVYVGSTTAPADSSTVRVYTGPVYASSTQVWAQKVTVGRYYRVYAQY